MTDQEIRIAIAEACGWKRGRHFEQLLSTGEGETWDGWIDPHTDEWQLEAPDYPNDLNAMHEAEKTLTYEQLYEYVREIAFVHMQTRNANDWTYEHFIHIPARQRAEAFLRVLNLWKD